MFRVLASLIVVFILPIVAFILSDNPIVAFIPILLAAPVVLVASKLGVERGRRDRAAAVDPDRERR